MAHLHGGQFDPNADIYLHQYQTPSPIAHQAHGGAYTPGASVVSYQNQDYIQHRPTVSTIASSYSSQPTKSPITQTYNRPEDGYYQQQQMSQKQPEVYQMGTGPAQKDGALTQDSMNVTESNYIYASGSENAPKEFPIKLKGTMHFLEQRTRWRWRNPVLFQNPGYEYTDNPRVWRHRDFAGRVTAKPRSDRYLHHNDGYLRNMYISCTDEIYEGASNSTWKRTYVRKVAPLKVRLATWVIDFSYDPKSWEDWGIMILRALPAALAMTFVFWDGKPMQIRRNLNYAPVLYRYHGDAKVWSNMHENQKGLSKLARNNQVYRMLRPRWLCFLRDPFSDQGGGIDIRNVDDWEDSEGNDAPLDYLFVAYSTAHFSHASEQDMLALHHIAETACRAAKLPAYWVACSCMRDETELESDVYRISDVLRGSHSMIIAVGKGKSADSAKSARPEKLLQEWGSRMWTFPEVLLSPGRDIKVYTRDSNLQSPSVVPKNQFAAMVWGNIDQDVARNLIDHYLGNISLSRLELAVLALECLYSRQTTAYLPGDQAYALMGLLRMRPQIDGTDTPFQAFSRLSLANDSDLLLERYICTLPLSLDQPWYDMGDAYQSSLWDITPYCQVAGIADNDTVIIDGAWGVSIRWKSFYPVYWSTGPSFKRWIAGLLMEWNSVLLIIGIALIGTQSMLMPFGAPLVFLGVVFLVVFLAVWIMTPTLVRIIYGGKFFDTQSEMFGFEGHLNAPTIERAIFGGNFGRFSWSTNGSPLSRSVVNEFGERVGIDPFKDPEIRLKLEAAKHAKPGDMRIFTLVDTMTMELTLFEAVRPPTTLMFCASEGGMQRAIGCSYEWETGTLYRETVLRLQTTSLNRMFRVPRFRLGIQRQTFPSAPIQGAA